MCSTRRAWAERSKIRIQIGFEFVKQNFQFGIVEFPLGRNISRIDDDRATLLHDVDAIADKFVDSIAEPKRFAMNANPRTL